jgi:hypothetical protein
MSPDQIAYGIGRSVTTLVDHIQRVESLLVIYVDRFGAIPEMDGIVPPKQEAVPPKQEAKADELDTSKN